MWCQHYTTVKSSTGFACEGRKKSFMNKYKMCHLFSFVFSCSAVSPFASEGVIYPGAFALLVTKCGVESLSCLWVLLWPKAPGASHTSSDIDTLPPQHHSWHLIHSSGCSFWIPNSQQGIVGKCQCCVGLGRLSDMREIGKKIMQAITTGS